MPLLPAAKPIVPLELRTWPPVTLSTPVPVPPTVRELLLAHVPLDTVAVPLLPAAKPIVPLVLVTLPPVTLSVPVPLERA